MNRCFRCDGRPFAELQIAAKIGDRQFTISQDAADSAICCACMVELDQWVKAGRSTQTLPAAPLSRRKALPGNGDRRPM